MGRVGDFFGAAGIDGGAVDEEAFAGHWGVGEQGGGFEHLLEDVLDMVGFGEDGEDCVLQIDRWSVDVEALRRGVEGMRWLHFRGLALFDG